MLGNVRYYWNNNVTRAYATHEMGHGARLGHIADPAPAIMGNNPDDNYYISTQWRDHELLRQVYP